MTKANQFFAGSTTSPKPTTAPHPRVRAVPKYVTERQNVYTPNAQWLHCDIYTYNKPEYQRSLRLVQESRLSEYRKCRFRVRRLKDNVVVATGQHQSLSSAM